MGGNIRATAISANGSFVVAADDRGSLMSWGRTGEFFGRTTTDLAKRSLFRREGTLWSSRLKGGCGFILPRSIRSGLTTALTALTNTSRSPRRVHHHHRRGHPALVPHSSGDLLWQTDVTRNAITDLACSDDCSTIIVGSEDNTVLAIDRYGKIHWTYTRRALDHCCRSLAGRIGHRRRRDRRYLIRPRPRRKTPGAEADRHHHPATIHRRERERKEDRSRRRAQPLRV